MAGTCNEGSHASDGYADWACRHARNRVAACPKLTPTSLASEMEPYSTVTDFARFLGLSTSVPRATAV
jgi:hypothetical protein